MQGYLHQAPVHLGRTTQGRRGQRSWSPAPHRASAQLKAISFIPLPLPHTPASPSLSLPPPTHHTRSACLSGCPHASLHGAAGTLAVTPHHSVCTVVTLLACVCVCARQAVVKWHECARMCKSVRPSGYRNAQCCARVQCVLCFCVHLHFF